MGRGIIFRAINWSSLF
jgi:hypothetical protein